MFKYPLLRKLVCSFLITFGCCKFAHAQKQSTVTWLKDYTKPGVTGMGPKEGISFEYINLPNFKINSTSENAQIGEGNARVENNTRTKFKTRIPLLNRSGLKAVASVKYYHEEYNFSTPSQNLDYELYQSIAGQDFKTVGTSLVVLKPTRNKSYLIFRGSLKYSGRFESMSEINGDYRSFSLAAFWGYKRDKSTEFGFGLSGGMNLGVLSMYPVFMYNRTFNDKWGLEAFLPKKIHLRRNLNDKQLITIGATLDGARYYIPHGLDNEDGLRLNVSEIRAGVSFKQEILPVLWASIDVGYRNNIGFNANSIINNDVLISSNIPGSSYVSFKVFLTPPRKYMHK